MRIVHELSAFYGAEEIEIMCHYDLFEDRVFRNILQVLNDRVLVLVVEGVRNVIENEYGFLVRLFSGFHLENNVDWDFPYNITYLSPATPLGVFSDKILYCSQQFKVSNLILKLFQQEHL